MRAKVRDVMRYAGPKMMLRHPLLTLLHLFEGWSPEKKPTVKR